MCLLNFHWMFTLHTIFTGAMLGIIWFVQVVQYPLFRYVGQAMFPSYYQKHLRGATYCIGPFMLLETFSAVLLLYLPHSFQQEPFLLLNLVLLFGIWASTAFIQIPYHRQLESGFNHESITGLIRSNWIRTILWTLRASLLLYCCLTVK
jgi:hypothetical protein